MTKPTTSMTSRKAKSLGLKFYNTGKPCKRGHYADRIVGKYICVECKKINSAEEYKKKNRPERAHIKEQESGELHGRPCKKCGGTLRNKWRKCPVCFRERLKSKDAKDRKNKSRRIKRLQNIDEARELEKRIRKKNASVHRALAKKRNAQLIRSKPIWLTRAQRDEIRCLYKSKPSGHQVDHIVPVLSEVVCGLTVPWNLQYLTRMENHAKSNKFPTCQKSMQPACFDDADNGVKE